MSASDAVKSTARSCIFTRPTRAAHASARRVARELLRREELLSPPSCDIGFREVVALSKTGNDPLVDLVTTTQGTVSVELAPLLYTLVNISGRNRPEPQQRSQREREILVAIGEYIENLQIAYQELAGHETQRPLFPNKRPRR